MSKEVGGMVGSRRVQGAESAPTARRLGRGPWSQGRAVEREPETGRGSAAAARRVAGDGLA